MLIHTYSGHYITHLVNTLNNNKCGLNSAADYDYFVFAPKHVTKFCSNNNNKYSNKDYISKVP